jgi:hypothetical protein
MLGRVLTEVVGAIGVLLILCSLCSVTVVHAESQYANCTPAPLKSCPKDGPQHCEEENMVCYFLDGEPQTICRCIEVTACGCRLTNF